MSVAQDLAWRLVVARQRYQDVSDHLATIQEHFSAEEVTALTEQERIWLEKVVDVKQHDQIENLYELSGGRSKNLF